MNISIYIDFCIMLTLIKHALQYVLNNNIKGYLLMNTINFRDGMNKQIIIN